MYLWKEKDIEEKYTWDLSKIYQDPQRVLS